MQALSHVPQKLVNFTSSASNTLSALNDPKKITCDRLQRLVHKTAYEFFRSFTYALICWNSASLVQYVICATLPPPLLWVAFAVRLAFYIRFYVVVGFTVTKIMMIHNHIRHPFKDVVFFWGARPDDHPLLMHFWFDLGCDPSELSPEELSELCTLLKGEEGERSECQFRQYMGRKPKNFSRQAFDDFQYAVLNYQAIDHLNTESPMEKSELFLLLKFLSLGTKILSNTKVKEEESPFAEMAQKIDELQSFFGVKKNCQHFQGLRNILDENDYMKNPSLKQNPFLFNNLLKYKDLIQHLVECGIQSDLLTEALAICDQEMPELPNGVSFSLHFRTKNNEKTWENGLKIANREKRWYWHVDTVFWDEHKTTRTAERVGLVSTGYLSDKLLRPKHYKTTEFYKVKLPSGIKLSLCEKAEKIFLDRIKEMATTKHKWKTLELRNTLILKRDNADFSYFPFNELYLLASMTVLHKLPARTWNPETLDVTIPSKLWCSEFTFFLVIDALQQVNHFLNEQGQPKLPYPVDGYENTAGIHPGRFKKLLIDAGMLEKQTF